MHDAGLRVDTHPIPTLIRSFNLIPVHGEDRDSRVLRERVMLIELDAPTVTAEEGLTGYDERSPVVPLRVVHHAGDVLVYCVREPLGRHHAQRN